MAYDADEQTELGREVRAAVAAALKRFGDNDIAAIRVTTLRQIDQLINPEPEGFEINTRNDRPYQTELALKQASRVRAGDEAEQQAAKLNGQGIICQTCERKAALLRTPDSAAPHPLPQEK